MGREFNRLSKELTTALSARDTLSGQLAEARDLAARIISEVSTCRKVNTPEWIAYLCERLTAAYTELGLAFRVEYINRDDMLRIVSSPPKESP